MSSLGVIIMGNRVPTNIQKKVEKSVLRSDPNGRTYGHEEEAVNVVFIYLTENCKTSHSSDDQAWTIQHLLLYARLDDTP